MAKPIISKFSVIDADQNNIVSYVCYDDTVDEVEYVIYDNASGNIIIDQTIQTSGSSSMRTFTFPAGTIHNRFLPYYIKISVHNQNGKTSELSDAVLFYCHKRPSLSFKDVLQNSSSFVVPFPAYSFDASYVADEEEGESLTWYKYFLYNDEKNLLTSETHYGSLSQSFIVEGLDNNTSYYVRATGETVNGYFLDTGYCPFKIEYNGQLENLKLIAENEKHEGCIKLTSILRTTTKTEYSLLRIKRREVGTYNWTIVYERDVSNLIGTISTVAYDRYARGRGTKYQYTIVPVIDGIEQKGVTTTVVSEFEGAYLMDKDTTYFIGLDAKVSNVNRVQNSAVETTLSSKYPIVFYGSKTNYYSGNFSGTIIKYDRSRDYFDFDASIDYREQYINWLTNQKPKVLKMWDGRAWLINVVDNISYSDDEHYNKVEIAFDFVETGDLKDSDTLKKSDLI